MITTNFRYGVFGNLRAEDVVSPAGGAEIVIPLLARTRRRLVSLFGTFYADVTVGNRIINLVSNSNIAIPHARTVNTLPIVALGTRNVFFIPGAGTTVDDGTNLVIDMPNPTYLASSFTLTTESIVGATDHWDVCGIVFEELLEP